MWLKKTVSAVLTFFVIALVIFLMIFLLNF